MSRVATTNYGADSTTQFQWATTDDDVFDREFDLYRLAQALEHHTHASTRGLPVARLAAGAADSAAIAALAVTTEKIAALAVTNDRLGAGAVTWDKITWPLVQPSNDMTGGFRIRDTANAYAFGFYMAANGLAVLGSGTPASIPAGIIIDQTGKVSIGTLGGSGKLNVFQTGTTYGTGLRLYHTNQTHHIDIFNDVTGRMIFGANGLTWMHLLHTNGFLTLGSSATDTARLAIVQAASDNTQGIRWQNGGTNAMAFLDSAGALNLTTDTTSIKLERAAQTLAPVTNEATTLGRSGLRWGAIHATSITADTGVFATSLSGPGAVPLNGMILFRTAAELTAAGAVWARETNYDGRILLTAGVTFGQTFTENTAYGAHWTPLTGAVTGNASQVVLAGQTSNANTNVAPDHTHTIPTTTWIPPSRTVIVGRRIS